jgi:hypothetical protein
MSGQEVFTAKWYSVQNKKFMITRAMRNVLESFGVILFESREEEKKHSLSLSCSWRNPKK